MLPAAAAKGVRVETAIDREPSRLSGDADRLQQIAWNLMSNAVKFTPRAGHIGVNMRSTGSQIEILICDSGVGIAVPFLPHSSSDSVRGTRACAARAASASG